MNEECPICSDNLSGTLATLGCCKKVLHVECLIKCMKLRLACPMCRASHESLQMVQDTESQVLVPVAVRYNKQNSFRNIIITVAVLLLIVVECRK